MENRVYPDHITIRLFEAGDREKKHPEQFVLETCIGKGANCVAYRASSENGIPVKLKQFRPAGVNRQSSVYRMAEERFVQAYRQQIAMMQDERTAAVTSGLYGLYLDDSGYYWTSVSAMIGRTLDQILPENSLQHNLQIIRCVAESIKAYHEAGWLLLDVKPENILVIDSLGMRGINFFDFDSFIPAAELKKAIEEGRSILLSSSESYSAPELLEADVDLGEIGITADFYSVGALLFTAVFGRRPELFDCLPDCDYDFSTVRDAADYSADFRHTIRRFLNKTLTLSPFGRYQSDDSLIDALDEILRFADLDSPRLSRSVPGSVSNFSGREQEIQKLSSLLRSNASLIFLSGMGGIGKTQLALKVAKDLRDEFDFYYVPFKGSVRETLLSLPMENLRTERVDESGLPVRLPDSEIYDRILSCLRNCHDERSVLIIDGFDAEKDEDSPTLLYDPDFSDLESLPMQIVLTTRCRFEKGHTLPVENLDDASLIGMLSEAFPEEPDESLLQLADAVGRHTLTLSIISSSVKESKGNLSASKLLQTLQARDNSLGGIEGILSSLRSVFKASSLSRTACSVMSCACLFPQRGLSSDLLIRLFTPEQWVTANQLERSGWLHFDSHSCIWTVHPLIRAVCAAEKATQPGWENLGPFVSRLKKLKLSESDGEWSAEGRAQLNELFAAIGRLDLHKPFPWKRVTAAFFALAALLVFVFLRNRPVDESPVLSVQLFPNEEASAEDIAHDTEIILERLKTSGIKDATVDNDSGNIHFSTHTSLFGGIPNPEDTIRLLFNRPAVFYAIGSEFVYYYVEEISRDHILSAKAGYGIPPGVGREERKAAGLDISGEFSYLYLEVDEETDKILHDIEERFGSLIFAFDQQIESNVIRFAYTVPAEEEHAYYILDGRWSGENVYQTVAYNLMHEPLRSTYTFQNSLSPIASWEDPKQMTADAIGQNQKHIDEIPADSVIFSYSTSSPEEISDHSFQEALASLKRRFDQIGSPYAVGTDFFENRTIMVCMPTERVGYDIIRMLSAFSVDLDSFLPHAGLYFGSEYDYTAEVIEESSGQFALKLAADSDAVERLKSCTETMLAEGDHRIELNCGSNIAIASADFSQVVQDGILIFRELPFINCTSIGEDEVWILHVLCEIINENGRLSSASSVLYRWNKDIQFTSSVGSFGIRKELPRLDAVIERINQDFSPAEAWRNDSDEKENVYISLHCELPLDEVAVADMIENMYMQCEFEGTGADSYFIYLIDEESNERFRLVFNTPLWESQYGENDYVVELVVIGDRPEQYFEALWKEFSSREFFTSRDFSVQNLNYLLNSAQNSDQGE